MKPTRRQDWPKVGDRVTATADARMVGTVLRIVPMPTVPYALVQWPSSVGRHTITTLRVLP